MKQPDFLKMSSIQQAFTLAKQAGGEARLVGGVVRDWLAGRPLGDIDMAVNVPIERFCAYAKQANIRIIETGLAHGSVTMLYDDEVIEVTQTRADIKTDGRHAVIGFHPSFATDARRRDFTMNAIYLDETGALYDPLDGQADLVNRRLVFIGDAAQRITEDYLRILRYVRFVATIDDIAIDDKIIAQIKAHSQGLYQLSGERIIYELIKLFKGPHWAKAVHAMRQAGLDETLFGAPFLSLHDSHEQLVSWQARAMSCLSKTAFAAWQKQPFARKDLTQMRYLDKPISKADYACLASDDWHVIAYFETQDFHQRCVVQARYHEGALSQERLDELRNYDAPPCPVSGHDLQQAGFVAGPALGGYLQQAKLVFAKSAYSLSREEIITSLKQ